MEAPANSAGTQIRVSELRKRGAGRPGPVAPAYCPAPYCLPERGPSLKHPADFSVAVVRIVDSIARVSDPGSFQRYLSFGLLFLRACAVERRCKSSVQERPAWLPRLLLEQASCCPFRKRLHRLRKHLGRLCAPRVPWPFLSTENRRNARRVIFRHP